MPQLEIGLLTEGETSRLERVIGYGPTPRRTRLSLRRFTNSLPWKRVFRLRTSFLGIKSAL